MAIAALRVRSSLQTLTKDSIRSFSTHHKQHESTQEYSSPSSFIGSWGEPPKDPKDAERRLAKLRREYAKDVKAVRKEYIHEMEMMRIEKQRRDEARMAEVKAANEERKKMKAAAAEVRAKERMAAQEEFRQTLMKERAEKLENWKMKEKRRVEKKEEKAELVKRQSSMWIEEKDLEKKILEALVDTTQL